MLNGIRRLIAKLRERTLPAPTAWAQFVSEQSAAARALDEHCVSRRRQLEREGFSPRHGWACDRPVPRLITIVR